MKSVVKQGKTLEEAIEEALIDLNAKKEDVKIEIIDEPSKGLFGLIGVKEARVKVTITYDPKEIADIFLSKILSSMDIDAVNVIEKKDDKLLDRKSVV